MARLTRVLIMAGGTGGHVFPGLAVAKYLNSLGVEVRWLGTQKGLEARLVPEAGIPIHFISISGFHGKSLKNKLFLPFKLVIALIQSIKIIHSFNPDRVIGMGGFVSGPGGIASWLLRKKLMIHEQNAKPGSTNLLLAKIATQVLEAFPHTFLNLDKTKILTVGNPVREEIMALPSPDNRIDSSDRPRHLLVLGGSLGAQAINELLPKALAQLPEKTRPKVLHQTGEKHLTETIKSYEAEGIIAEIVPFIVEMNKAYAWADVVLCRAGALTIAELCAAGLGAILVPFPYAAGDHQTANANFMVQNGAALLVQQAELTEYLLADILKMLCNSIEKCKAMAKAAYALRQADATKNIVAICQEMGQ
jgi:UDP-N-acetylglucosamine--N-acetylmuramyl-(pentapeptide) pyrophosphoryl-undecaprenol N-acetylglucosamine transferase